MKIQLITFAGCPHADAARELLRRCLSLAGLPPTFEEIDSMSPDTAAEHRDWGSPTILVEGIDVGGQQRPMGPTCRLYLHADGRTHGPPPESLLLEAIRLAKPSH